MVLKLNRKKKLIKSDNDNDESAEEEEETIEIQKTERGKRIKIIKQKSKLQQGKKQSLKYSSSTAEDDSYDNSQDYQDFRLNEDNTSDITSSVDFEIKSNKLLKSKSAKRKKSKKKKKKSDSSPCEKSKRKTSIAKKKKCRRSASDKDKASSILSTDTSSSSDTPHTDDSYSEIPKKKPSLVYPVMIDGLLKDSAFSLAQVNSTQLQYQEKANLVEEKSSPIVESLPPKINAEVKSAPEVPKTSLTSTQSLPSHFYSSPSHTIPNSISSPKPKQIYIKKAKYNNIAENLKKNFPNPSASLTGSGYTNSFTFNNTATFNKLKFNKTMVNKAAVINATATNTNNTHLMSNPSTLNNKLTAFAKTTKLNNTVTKFKNTSEVNLCLSTNQTTQQVAGPYIYSVSNKVILVMEPQFRFTFLGKLKIRVIYGSIALYGTVLTQSDMKQAVEIYSPKGFSSITISNSNVPENYNKEYLWDWLVDLGIDRAANTKLHETIEKCKEQWSVIVLETINNSVTNFLSNYCPLKVFPKIESTIQYSWTDPKQAENILQSSLKFNNSENEVSIFPHWNQSLTDMIVNQWITNKQLKTVLIGGKGVGKSTSSRYLINSLLQHTKKVIYVDLDPGQAEFTPSGCVSISVVDKYLLGPNFTHLKQPYYSLYLQEINVSNCINKYINYIKNLCKCLDEKEELKNFPIVINTMGFCKGIGLDIAIFTIKLFDPTDVIQITSSNKKSNFDIKFFSQDISNYKTSSILSEADNRIYEKHCKYNLHFAQTAVEGKRVFDSWNIEPRQQRDLVTFCYLSQIVENAEDCSLKSIITTSINDIVPYELPFSSFCISITTVGVPSTHILAAMNGNIVALCGIDFSEEVTKSEDYPLVILRPPACTCYGFGIVRGTDMEKKSLFINTPLKQSVLQHVNFLNGCRAIPFSVLHSQKSITPYSAEKGGLPTCQETRRGVYTRSEK